MESSCDMVAFKAFINVILKLRPLLGVTAPAVSAQYYC
jgi:hypothetical protein